MYYYILNSDARNGARDGDDESVRINLSRVSEYVESFWIFLSVYDSNKSLMNIKNSYMRLMIEKEEFCRYNLKNNI